VVLRLAVIVGLALGACATPDTVETFCARADECNDLPSGVSRQDCVDVFHSCVDKLTSSQEADWTRMIEGCLSDNSCQLFASCYGQVPWC
jgi:hypothetical protein